MAYKKYILPKSIFVETRTIADRERPTIANYGLDLYKFIQSVVDDVIPGTILSANNGLHVTGNFIQLGGDLIQNTIIDGDSTYDLTIQDVELMTLSVTDLDLSGVTVYISDASLAGASNGDVWTLVDDATGEGAWQTLPAVTVIGANNGLNLDAGNVQLGGVLSEVTNIDANAFDFSLYSADEIFIEGSNVRVNGTTNLIDGLNVTLNGQTMCTIQADTVLQVQSPGYATALNRISALHMIDNSTGEAEFKALNFFPITTVAVAGVYHVSGEDSTILADPTTAGGVILIDLPAATGVGMLVRVKQITAGAVTIASLSGDLWTTTNVASIPGVHGTTYTLQADGTYWQVL